MLLAFQHHKKASTVVTSANKCNWSSIQFQCLHQKHSVLWRTIQVWWLCPTHYQPPAPDITIQIQQQIPVFI